MAKTPAPKKTGSGKKKEPPDHSSGRAKWLLLAAVVLASLLYWVLQLPTDDKKIPVPSGRTGVEKTESDGNVDYLAASQKIHVAVDKALGDVKGVRKDFKEIRRETPRTVGSGNIRWHARQLWVAIPAETTKEALEKNLTSILRDVGGMVLTTEPDQYQGVPVTRVDLGFRDTLAGDPITIITDRVYILRDKGSETGVIPEATKSLGKGKGELAIIVDDFGYTADPITAFINLGKPLTFAVLPYRPHSSEAVSRANAAGLPVMLHLPLEPISEREESEAITVTVAMSDDEIQKIVSKAIASLPGISGVNNHQGSRATMDRRVMREVLNVVKKQNLFFVDSRTTGQSVAAEVSRNLGVRTGENELFLDNSADVGAIKKQLRAAGEMALRHGSATVICHARPNTAIALREGIPELENQGVRLVYVSKLLK